MFVTICCRPTLWDAILPPEAVLMPAELEAVDRLLNNPRFFEPLRKWFNPVMGRPSIPMESYLRLMFLKYRYRIGFEVLCREVNDSLSWRMFCRLPLGEKVPHPSTLEKITTRVGSSTILELNQQLVRSAVEAGVVDLGWVRADTTVVPADISYPTDSGLLCKAIGRLEVLCRRVIAAGVDIGGDLVEFRPEARTRARAIAIRLRQRAPEAKADVLAVTGELADLAESALSQARSAFSAAGVALNAGHVSKVLRRTVASLAQVIEAVEAFIAQARVRVAGDTPAADTRRLSIHDPDAKVIRKGSLAKPTQFGYAGQLTDNAAGIVLDYELEPGIPADAPRLAPAIGRVIGLVGQRPSAVTADRSYGDADVAVELASLGVTRVGIVRKGKPKKTRAVYEASEPFQEMIRWRTGSEGRVATMKRQCGWSRSGMSGLEPTRIWCGWGVLAHNAVKISTLIK